MSEIFLTRVDFENFRTFGRFGVDLPAAPGLTLLVGTNGLGKSSFFDGLEWGLTGRIRRFVDHLSTSVPESEYLTRRGAPENSHKISLRFNSGNSIQRSAFNFPEPSEIIDLLKSDNWGKIEDVGTYLALTHFLGQSAQQRFTNRQNNEQWQSLKGPSGMDRLEQLRNALRGRTTQNAFRKRGLQQQSDVVEAGKAINTWREMSDRLQRLRETAKAKGNLSESELTDRIAALEGNLKISPSSKQKKPTPAQRLLGAREEILRNQALISQELAALQGIEGVASSYNVARTVSDPEGTQITAAQNLVGETTKALIIAEKATFAAQSSVREQESLVEKLEADIVKLTNVRGDIEKQNALNLRQEEILTRMEQTEKALSIARNELSNSNSQLDMFSKRKADLDALNVSSVTAQSYIQELNEIERLLIVAREKETAANKLEADGKVARSKLQTLTTNYRRIQKTIELLETTIQRTRLKVSELAAAVARIASHLDDHDTRCPVCTTEFDAGDLKKIADAAATAQSSELAGYENEHRNLVVQASDLRESISSLERLIVTADSAVAAATLGQKEAINLRDRLTARAGVPADTDLAVYIIRHHAEIMKKLDQLSGEISEEAPSIATVHSMQKELVLKIAALERNLVELKNSNAGLVNERLGINERLSALGHSHDTPAGLSGSIEELNLKLSEAREKLTALKIDASALASTESDLHQRSAKAKEEFAQIFARVGNATRDMASLQSQWHDSGLDGTPMVATLEARRSKLGSQFGALNVLLNEQVVLAAANEKIVQLQDINDLIKLMENEAGPGTAESPESHLSILQNKLNESIVAHEITETAHAAINDLSKKLQLAAEEFSYQFLVPLNDLIDDYNKALLTTPGESIRFSAQHNVDRTKFEMRLRNNDRIDLESYNTELPPQVVLSEGQLAANGFSILCAASTAYPWSRWRALLLDDPLQHNDIIHAAAFADVMRNLVEFQGYQLIMSSHDRGESEFFARKFDAAGLPCTVITLTAPSRDGVKIDPPKRNSAASRALSTNDTAKSG